MVDMNINDIIKRKAQLENELRLALSTMEKKDTIQQIKEQIKLNQQNCPHDTQYYSAETEGECAYCGKKRGVVK